MLAEMPFVTSFHLCFWAFFRAGEVEINIPVEDETFSLEICEA